MESIAAMWVAIITFAFWPVWLIVAVLSFLLVMSSRYMFFGVVAAAFIGWGIYSEGLAPAFSGFWIIWWVVFVAAIFLEMGSERNQKQESWRAATINAALLITVILLVVNYYVHSLPWWGNTLIAVGLIYPYARIGLSVAVMKWEEVLQKAKDNQDVALVGFLRERIENRPNADQRRRSFNQEQLGYLQGLPKSDEGLAQVDIAQFPDWLKGEFDQRFSGQYSVFNQPEKLAYEGRMRRWAATWPGILIREKFPRIFDIFNWVWEMLDKHFYGLGKAKMEQKEREVFGARNKH